jgi:TonB family protein
MVTRNTLLLIAGIILTVPVLVQSKSNDRRQTTLSDEEVRVTHFEGLVHPSLQQRTSSESEGVVVVKAKLDREGKVIEASALSGNEELAPDSVANVRKWQFQPNVSQSAVVVYNFRSARGVCKSSSSLFTLEESNLVSVVTCWPSSVKVAKANDSQQGVNARTSDRAQVLDFEDLRYPALASAARIHGVVVVQVKLDEEGEVIEASAIAGHPMLVPECLANVRKWRFRPNPQSSAIVVYLFRLVNGYYANDQSQFVLEPPNLATITAKETMSPAQPRSGR